MTIRGLSLLFAGAAVAHSGLKAITVDGTTYPPFDDRIDNFLGSVRRIEWSHDVPIVPWAPITNVSDPGIACQRNPKPPLLKATARAGADVTFHWTPIVRMHFGPVIAYLGELPTPNTKPQDVKFFKIFEKGFDVAKGEWGNEIASDHNDSYKVQIPSDIKSGTYILRTELLALHGNAALLKATPLSGPQFYPYCINVEVIGGGSAQPEGVKFPGAYKKTDFGVAFGPYIPLRGQTSVAPSNAQGSKYVPPGPPLYKGKFDAPTGQPPVVRETGAYTGESKVKYDKALGRLEQESKKLIAFVNEVVWQDNKINPAGSAKFPSVVQNMVAQRQKILKELGDLKDIH